MKDCSYEVSLKGSIRVSRQDLELAEVTADGTSILRPKLDPGISYC